LAKGADALDLPEELGGSSNLTLIFLVLIFSSQSPNNSLDNNNHHLHPQARSDTTQNLEPDQPCTGSHHADGIQQARAHGEEDVGIAEDGKSVWCHPGK
jgi:hypothetical protein